jgi:hypothetical protein
MATSRNIDMKITGLLSCLALVLLTQLTFGQNSGTLSGRVVDAKTGEPLIGASVFLQGTDLGGATDVDGSFSIGNIPPKTYNIEASYVGYTTSIRYNIVIRSEGNIDLTFELKEQANELGEVVVKPNPFQKSASTPLSIQELSQEEIAAYPGGNNDIAKVVQTLPGISGSVGGFRNDVIIRGGAPNENVYYLDGIEIPNINHFATQGSAGGPVGLLNVSFFEGVTLSASAFGAQYDNVLSGVLQFDQRTGNAREFTGNVRVSSSEAALTLEGPLFKGEAETAKTTYIVSARRSYLQLLFEVIGLPFLPDYWDFQYKINHEIDEYNSIYLTGVGSIDDFSVNELDEFDPEQQASQDQVPVIKQRSNAAGISWRRRFKDNSGLMTTTLSYNTLANDFLRYEDNVAQTGLFFRNDSRETETRLRYSLTKFMGEWTTSFGGSLIGADYQNTTADQVNDLNFQTDLSLVRYGFFAQANRRLLQDRLGFSVGLRADGNNFTDDGGNLGRTISPRLSLSYRLDPEGDWTVNASAGRYYRILPYTTLGFQSNTGDFVNKSASYIQSDHLVAGLEYLVSPSARITVEGFYKGYSDYPVSIRDGISLANKGGGFEVFGSEPVRSVGLGRSYGAEFLYQQKFTGQFYAIGALTLYRSEFTGLDTDEYLPAVWDNQVLISLLAGYKFGKNWEVSGRFRYLGSAPYAPVDQEATLEAYPAVISNFDQLGSVRLDPFSQLDIRVDKKWNFSGFSLDVFLDIQNVLAQDNPQIPQYGLDRTETGEVITPEELVQVSALSEGSILPSLGIVLNF